MGSLSAMDIAILAAECVTAIGLLTGIIILSGKRKKLRMQNEEYQEQRQRDSLDEILMNAKRR